MGGVHEKRPAAAPFRCRVSNRLTLGAAGQHRAEHGRYALPDPTSLTPPVKAIGTLYSKPHRQLRSAPAGQHIEECFTGGQDDVVDRVPVIAQLTGRL